MHAATYKTNHEPIIIILSPSIFPYSPFVLGSRENQLHPIRQSNTRTPLTPVSSLYIHLRAPMYTSFMYANSLVSSAPHWIKICYMSDTVTSFIYIIYVCTCALAGLYMKINYSCRCLILVAKSHISRLSVSIHLLQRELLWIGWSTSIILSLLVETLILG
jgi:hypothetical protein